MKTLIIICCLFALVQGVVEFPGSSTENKINDDPFQIILKACKYRLKFLQKNNRLNSNDTFSLAIQIKETLEALSELKDEQHLEVTKKFKSLVEELPLSVITLIFNSRTHLYNKYHEKEFLYTISSNDSEKRKVFTWRPGGRGPNGIWQFSSDDDGKSFLIKSVAFNEYLYAGDDSLLEDSSRRNVFTWLKDSENERKWIVEIVGESEIMFKSKDRNEYFFAAYGAYTEGNRRKVFNWRAASACDDTCIWMVSPETGSIVVAPLAIRHLAKLTEAELIALAVG
jgi:hypothetical protein